MVSVYLSCGEYDFCISGRENLCSNLKGVIGISQDGGYAEYLKAPFDCLFFISDDIPFEKAAIIPNAIATSCHAITSKAKIQSGESFAIIGVGGLGLHAIQIAKVFGARVIAVDSNEKALAIAEEMGAERALKVTKDDPTGEIVSLSGGRGIDAVIDFVGNPRIEKIALNILKGGGKSVVVGYNPNNHFRFIPSFWL